MKKLFAIGLIALSFNVLADQCQWVTEASAKKAVSLIKKSKKTSGGVLDLCQLCGESEANEVVVNQIDVSSTGDTLLSKQVSINGSAIDLAYTYVDIGNATFVNLAKLSNCEATGVSDYIHKVVRSDGKVRYIPGPVNN